MTEITRAGHCDSEPLEIRTLVMGHSLVRSLVHSYRSLIRLLRTARSLAHSLPSSWDNGIFLFNFQVVLNRDADFGILVPLPLPLPPKT